MSRNSYNNTALIVFGVIAAFGLVMATIAILPNVHAIIKSDKLCKDGIPLLCNGSHNGH